MFMLIYSLLWLFAIGCVTYAAGKNIPPIPRWTAIALALTAFLVWNCLVAIENPMGDLTNTPPPATV